MNINEKQSDNGIAETDTLFYREIFPENPNAEEIYPQGRAAADIFSAGNIVLAKPFDPDIVEMDFPPYSEEQSPFPDVEADFNFYENKDEIYLRNIELAKGTDKKTAVYEERRVEAKKEDFEKIYNDAYLQAYRDAQQKLAVQQQNYPASYHGGGVFNFIEDFLSLFSPNRTVDLNKMSWQIVRACVFIAFIIFLIISAVMD